MEVEFLCADCRRSNRVEAEDARVEIQCAGCDKKYGTFIRALDEKERVQYCIICGCRDLFMQKDFNRKLGCGIAAVGAALAPFTKLVSLLVCALVDLILYRVLPLITICYKCHSIYRDFTPNPQHEGFNLGINDRYRTAERK